jgi:glutathione peroxidase
MKTKFLASISLVVIATAIVSFVNPALKTFHDFTVKTIDGTEFSLSQLKGKKVLVVNVASKCGLTPQYKDLQALYEKYGGKDFEIIAFPANNFLKQEPGNNEEIKEFCTKNYGVTFPVMDKVSVADYIYKGYPAMKALSDPTEKSEIYKWLTEKSQNGLKDTDVKWNFHKFLIDENGNLIADIEPKVGKDLEKVLLEMGFIKAKK